MPQFGDPGRLCYCKEPQCLHIKYENEQGQGICEQGRDGLCSPMPNECNDLAVRKLFLLPTCPDIASLLSKKRLACLHEVVRVLVRKSMWTPACRFRVRESPANADAARPCRVPKS